MKETKVKRTDKLQFSMVKLILCVFRWDGVQAEGFPGLHSLSAAERHHPGPGGESEDHPRRWSWMSGPLQQLRLSVPAPRSLLGENQQLFLWLRPVSLHWSLLWQRYAGSSPWCTRCNHEDALQNYQCPVGDLFILIWVSQSECLPCPYTINQYTHTCAPSMEHCCRQSRTHTQ